MIAPSADDRRYNRGMSQVTVRLPTALQPFADGAKEIQVTAATVAEALAAADGGRGTLIAHLLTPDGAQRPLVNLFLGESDIRSLDGLNSTLRDGDVIMIVAAVAGG
jgi:molybdopterin synthase sulfur carrier subunit